MNVLTTENIFKSYMDGTSKLEVLKNINLSISKRDLIAVTGESGSGKSTLINVLGLLDKPDSGKIKFFDNEINFKSRDIHEFRNKNIGFVLQSHYLLEDFNVQENVAMPMFIRTKNFKKSMAEAKKILTEVGLMDRLNFYPNQLSGGEQQRSSIARAIINRPDILMADEPTGNLDQKNSDIVIDLLINLNKLTNTAILLVTHNMEIVKKMNKHFVLVEGNLELI